MPATTPRRRGRPRQGEVPLSSAERNRRCREQRKRVGKIRLEIWLPVQVVERIKQEAASSKRRLGATVAAHIERSLDGQRYDGQRYQEANQQARALLNDLLGSYVQTASLEKIIAVLQEPLFPGQRSRSGTKPATAHCRVPAPDWEEPKPPWDEDK